MPDESRSEDEERELLDLLAKSALNDYPNPQRTGCPGREFLERLAFSRESILLSNPRLDHIVHCSPCFRELSDIKTALQKRKRAIWIGLAAAAALILIAVGVWWSGAFGRLKSPGRDGKLAPIIAEIDLQNSSIPRGSRSDSQQNRPIVIPRGQLRLTILLPFGSDAGTYEIQMFKEVGKPLITSAGQAATGNGVTKLDVHVNTSLLAPGSYLLGVRQPPLESVFNPITIR
jgi:hypothetical protein